MLAKDDRGTVHKFRPGLPADVGLASRYEFLRMFNALFERAHAPSKAMVGVAVCVVLFFVLMCTGSPQVNPAIVVVLIAAALLTIWGAAHSPDQGHNADTTRVARCFARHGFCGACGYGITGLKPEADDCVVCPECAAAWASEPIESMHAGPDARATLPVLVREFNTGRSSAKRTALDAGGAKVSVLHANELGSRAKRMNDAHAARIFDARAAMRRAIRTVKVLFFVAWNGLMIPLAILMWLGPVVQGDLEVGNVFMLLALCAVVNFITARSLSAPARQDVGRLLARALCPACAADLLHGWSFRPGITECPACMAEWKWSKPASPTPPPPPSSQAPAA